MGKALATEACFLYNKIISHSVHDSTAHHVHHSDSWRIKKTAEDIDIMQTALDNVLQMVTILAQQAQQAQNSKQDDTTGGSGDVNRGKREKKKKKNKSKDKPNPPSMLRDDEDSNTGTAPSPPPSKSSTKVQPFSTLSGDKKQEGFAGSSKVAPAGSPKVKKTKTIKF